MLVLHKEVWLFLSRAGMGSLSAGGYVVPLPYCLAIWQTHAQQWCAMQADSLHMVPCQHLPPWHPVGCHCAAVLSQRVDMFVTMHALSIGCSSVSAKNGSLVD
jgi:hypothetical protein